MNCDPNKLLFSEILQYFALPNESLDLALITVAIFSIWTSFGLLVVCLLSTRDSLGTQWRKFLSRMFVLVTLLFLALLQKCLLSILSLHSLRIVIAILPLFVVSLTSFWSPLETRIRALFLAGNSPPFQTSGPISRARGNYDEAGIRLVAYLYRL